MATTCVCGGNRSAHERFRSTGAVWHRRDRCNHFWRGLGQALAAVFARPHLDEAQVINRRSSSHARVSEQGPAWAEHWLADVEARFAVKSPVAPGGSGIDTAVPTADAGDHWLAGLEAAYEQGAVGGTTSSADGYPAPVETSSVDVARSDLDEVPTSGEPWLDDWVVAEMGRRVERPVEDPGRRPWVDHLDEPGVTVLQAGRPVPTVAIAVAVARLGDMGADLLRVGETLARGEAGFQRLVSRWNPADPWLQPGDQTP